MAAPGNTTTTRLQFWLELMQAGDGQARQELMGHACERLRKLTRRMLRGYPLVRRWEQTDDVLQNSMMRLYRALADVTPESLRHFYSLASPGASGPGEASRPSGRPHRPAGER